MFRREIQAGIELLNDKAEPEWFNRIDTEKLDMTIYSKCVLGQLFQDFIDGVHLIRDEYDVYTDILDDIDWSVQNGFAVPSELPRSFWAQLRAEWVVAINKLRAENAQAGFAAIDLCLALFILAAVTFEGWLYFDIADMLKLRPIDIVSVIAAAVGGN